MTAVQAMEDPARPTASHDELRAALDVANIPTLLLVLTHLTGDESWLEGPYRPVRTVATDDNDTGGLPEERQYEVRAAALDVLDELRDGRRAMPPAPSDEQLVAWLGTSMGERIPLEYGTPMAEDSGFRPTPWQRRAPLVDAPRVLIIGAGIYGLATAAALRHLGVPYVHVERGDGVGGTWRDNAYPGAGVDTPCHLYSFSFAPRSGWTRHFAKQPEILGYLRDTARRLGVLDGIRFDTAVESAVWDDEAATWEVHTRDAAGGTERHVVDVVVSAVGHFTTPSVPSIPGLDTFPGPAFHSARWPRDLDLRGKRVGVIGTGATSMQAVPSIADDAARTVVFQRSPQWVIPNRNYLRPVDEQLRLLMAQVPGYRGWYRARLMWQYQDKLVPSLQKDPEWPHPERSLNATNDRHRAFFTRHLDAELAGGGEHLRDAVLPGYPPYGKRILIDNNWYATLRRDDVELVAEAVTAVDGNAVVTADGARHEVDVLVLATGFSTQRMLFPMDVRGRSGVPLRDQWGDDDPRAHLGMSVPDFPNFFVMYGPNTNAGHGGSAIFTGECQVNYIVEMLALMQEHGIASVEARADVTAAYNERLAAAHERMVWTHEGMTTYYRNAAGRVTSVMPWRLVDYWAMTRHPELDDFVVRTRSASSASAEVGEGVPER